MATNITGAAPLPNPFTPLAFLPPTVAKEHDVAAYLYVAVLSAFIWDWLMTIPEEIRMCRKRKFRPTIVAYFLSRIGTLGYTTLAVIFQIAPVLNCNAILNGIGACFIIGIPASSALFFFRVRAVYCNNKIITAFFGFLWFAVFGLSFVMPLSGNAIHIGTTQICLLTEVANYASAPTILNAVFDTLVFVTISLRMVSHGIADGPFLTRARSFFRGNGLHHVSRSLLQSGQLYYFVTIGLNILVVIMINAPVPPLYRAILSVPNIALESAMACRVFRGVQLGRINGVDGIATNRSTSLSLPTTTFGNEFHVKSYGARRDNIVPIEITKTTVFEESSA